MSLPQLEKAISRLLEALELSAAHPDAFERVKSNFLEACLLLPYKERAVYQELISLSAPSAPARPLLIAIQSFWLKRGKTFKDKEIHIIKEDGSRRGDHAIPPACSRFVVILDNLRSVFNVGSIFRSAECLALGEIALCGISPGPEHPNFAKTAMNTQDKLPHRRFTHTADAIDHYRSSGYRIVALETAATAISVFDYQATFPLALILGNESLGISPDVLELADEIISLPVLGWKNSLNVGVAFATVAYQLVFHPPLSS